MYLLFAFVALPTIFCMLVWVVVTVRRLCFPARPVRYRARPVLLRRHEQAVGEVVPVGVREIRENQRRAQAEHPYVRYYYTGGYSHGVPAAWLDDLWQRRN